VQVKTFVLGQPRLYLGVFVGSVVIDDQVQIEFLGRLVVDAFEKLEPLLMAVLGASMETIFPSR
jgi:hypothetical protein